MSTYKPTEHGGLKEDGTPDKRVGTGEFAQGKVDPVEAGKMGGHASGGGAHRTADVDVDVDVDDSEDTSDYSSNGGNGQGSKPGQFAHGKVDPVEAGKKGGKMSA